MQRPLMNGPRSLIRTRTDRSLALFITVTWLRSAWCDARRLGRYVEPFAGSRPAAVVAIPNAVLAGDARFFLGHLDVDRDNAFEKILDFADLVPFFKAATPTQEQADMRGKKRWGNDVNWLRLPSKLCLFAL